MTLALLTQSLAAGIINGLIYALVGTGIAAIFKGSKVPNVMQGEFSVVGAVIVVVLLAGYDLPYWFSILCGCLTGAALGAVIEILLVRELFRKNAPEDSYMLLTVGISMTISAAVLFLFGRESHLLPAFGGGSVHVIAGAVLQEHALWLIGIALLISVLLRGFYRHTSLGLKMMAASIDSDGATTIGINVPMMRTLTFALGGLVGAIAGILITPIIPVDYMVGLQLTLKGFAAAILGGITSPLGALVGGVTLGLIEALVVMGVSASYKEVITFSLLIAIMVVMPHGLLGRAGRVGG